jgi:hypothetical protein
MITRAGLAAVLCSSLGAVAVAAQGTGIEAESLNVRSGWEVIGGRQGFAVGQPMLWSAKRLRAGADDASAVASADISVPAAGVYNLWVRYDSPYGFDTLFSVEVRQGKRVQQGDFGGKEQSKYFPFGRGWRVQGPWHWHGSDFVYQKMTVDLLPGKATLRLRKDRNGYPAAPRVVDLLYLTDDLQLEPGDDWSWGRKADPAILGHFRTPVYMRAQAPAGGAAPVVKVSYRFWLLGYYKGPQEDYWLTPDAVTTEKPAAASAPAGEASWQRLEFSTVLPALLTLSSATPAELEISTDPKGRGAVRFAVGEAPIEVVAATGNSIYEDAILRGAPAVRLADYLDWVTAEIEQTPVVGRRAKRFGLTSSFGGKVDGFDTRRLAAACGLTGQHYRTDPEVYGPEGDAFGFNRTRGYLSLQNGHLTQACYEGDYTALEKQYRATFDSLKAKGLEAIPQDIKLIEESGPPSLATLRTWPKVNEAFRAYLKEQGGQPIYMLSRDALIDLVNGKTPMDPQEQWARVTLGLGTPEEAATQPVLFYHSVDFRALLFARNSAAATRLVEGIFAPGTHTNSGSFFPSTGGTPAIGRGEEPFLLFRERGVTSFSSEISWGLNTPEYVGPQTESYGIALGRALTKYGGGPIGSYLIVDGNRGYTPEFVELASYAMASQGASWWDFYSLGYPTECNVYGFPEILKAFRRISFRLGDVEDMLLDTAVVPARVAIGWSRSTDIWDLAEPTCTPDGPGNTIYPQERCNLYLLLRHLQLPVDLMSEDDVAEGYLKDVKVFFLVGDHLSRRAALALRDWVEAGGFLISVAGGGLRDIYDKPLQPMERLFGIKSADLRKEAEALRPKLELLDAEPLDTIAFDLDGGRLSLPAFGYRQSFEVDGGQVLGTFRDGKPAAVLNGVGKGKALIVGTLPGAAYLKDAFPLAPFGRGGEEISSALYPAYDSGVRELVRRLLACHPDALSAVTAPVVSREPLVEVTLRRNGKTGAVLVALVNFSGRALPALTLDVDAAALGGVQEVRASFGQVKQAADAEGGLTLTMPLDRFEVLTFTRP